MGRLKNNKKAIIIVVSILVIIGIGVMYVLFTDKGEVKETAKSGALRINYIDSNEVNVSNVTLGWSETKTFTVENTGKVKANYNINWKKLLNEYVGDENLIYTLSRTSSNDALSKNNSDVEILEDTALFPDSGKNIRIMGNIDIDPGVVQTYKLTISYWDTGKGQKDVYNKKLVGKLEVLDINEDTVVVGENAAEAIIAKYSKENTEGLIKIDQPATVQTKETTEYRYSGSDEFIKNYVTFNDEPWRIIGVFDVDDGTGKIEKRVKIISDYSLGNYSWDSSVPSINNGYGSNQWGETGNYAGSDLMRELNDIYYNSKRGACYNSNNNVSTPCNFEGMGLDVKARYMVDNAKWYTGASSDNINVANHYEKERSNAVGAPDRGQSITKTSNWIGKVGLMYPSDYGYATSGGSSENLNTCRNTSMYNWGNSSYAYCKNNDWLYKNILIEGEPDLLSGEWLLTPYESNNFTALSRSYNGNFRVHNASIAHNFVYPVVYLSSRVQITSGTGAYDAPYVLSI